MHRHLLYIAPVALAACLWTAAGETSDPVLAWHELPSEIGIGCLAGPVATSAAPTCTGEGHHTSHWVGRDTGGDVFLVVRTPCDSGGCGAWLVQRTGATVRTLLAVTGEFRLQRASKAYPSVQERTALSNDYVRYSRFVWNGTAYVRSETRLVHTVDGFECGTTDECNDAARAALKGDDADRAVRIWQHVHGVAWI